MSRTHSRPLRLPRRGLGLVVTVALASTVGTLVGSAPASANAYVNWFEFNDNGDQSVTVGANALVTVQDGVLAFDPQCSPQPPGGATPINDFVYPVSDLYVVKHGTTLPGVKLTDASGHPHTIIGSTSGEYSDEVIGITAPTGKLPYGDYDLVFNTCQTGVYNPLEDTIYANAIHVVPPPVIPPISPALQAIKNAARQTAQTWQQIHIAWAGMLGGDLTKFCNTDALAKDPSTYIGCLVGYGFYGSVNTAAPQVATLKKQLIAATANELAHYTAIANDPPDTHYTDPSTIDPVPGALATPDDPLLGAMRDTASVAAAEASVAGGVLHAMERYEGASQAGDPGAALSQAQQAANLADVLATQAATAKTALSALRAQVAADGTFDGDVAAYQQFVDAVRAGGFTPDQTRGLRNLGFDWPAITQLEAGIAGEQVVPLTDADVLARIDAQLASDDAVVAAAQDMAAGMADIADSLSAEPGVAPAGPTAAAGGPYTATAGQPLTLDGGGSTDDGTAIASYAWDLNADGTFGDATGARPTVTLPAGFRGPVGLRVTTTDGRTSVGYATVTVADDGTPPTLSAQSPAAAHLHVTTGTTQTLSVQAADSDGDPVTLAWSVDGTDTGTGGTSFAYTPTGTGVHTVSVTASDGVAGHTVRHDWTVAATPVDSDGDGWTANVDCNDANPDVHPGRSEIFGNGIDDDCDPGTPDVPPGGVPGRLVTWGSTASNLTDGQGHTFDNFASVAAGYRASAAVDTNGEAYVWGPVAADGDGTTNSYSWPHPVAAVGATGSAQGVLTGVTQISNDEGDMLALLGGDGSVVGWGQNGNGQLGDGTRTQRLTPVHVVGVGGTGTLTGATQVLTANSESFAVLGDGTVDGWGLSSEFCEGYTSWVTSPFNQLTPIPLTWIGGNVAKVARAVGATLFLKNDGQVVGCDGSGNGLDGRVDSPWTNSYAALQVGGFGPGSGIVDLAVGGSGTALALRNDGTVFTWGRDYNGSLGLGPSVANTVVSTPTPVPLPPGPKVIAVDAGTYAQEALRADGTVLVWGYNNGNTGTGQSAGQVITTPTLLALPAGEVVRALDADAYGVALAGDPRLPLTPPTLDVHAGAAKETDSTLPVTVTLSASLPTDTTVHVATVAGTARPGTDYTPVDTDVTIPAGSTSATVAVPVLDDGTVGADKAFDVQLSQAPSGVTPGATMAVATVLEADTTGGPGLPTLSVTDATAVQPPTGESPMHFTVSLDAPSNQPVIVHYATADGSADATDYDTATGTVTIPAGQTSASLDLLVRAEQTPDEPETFTLTLSDPVNAVLGKATATGTVTNATPFAVTAAPVTLSVPTSGSDTARIPVTVSPPPTDGQTVTVDYATIDLSATGGTDYTATSGTVTLTAVHPTASIDVPVLADPANTGVRTFAVTLSHPTVTGTPRPALLDPRSIAVELVGHATPPDTVPPVVTGAATTTPNQNGWYNTDVTIHWAAVDPDTAPGVPGSGIDASTMPPDTLLTGEGAGLATPSVTVRDLAGNSSAPAQVTGINIDRTSPAVTITGPQNGATYTLGAVPAAACTASDALSGVDGRCQLTVTGGTGLGVGTFLATATATDKAGNTATVEATYRVTYGWGGFLPPIPAPGHTATGSGSFTAGATVPVTFQLTTADGTPVAASALPEWLTPASAGPTSGAPQPSAPAPSGSYYSAVTGVPGQYQYNWRTPRDGAGRWWVIGVRLDDGTVHTVAVALK